MLVRQIVNRAEISVLLEYDNSDFALISIISEYSLVTIESV